MRQMAKAITAGGSRHQHHPTPLAVEKDEMIRATADTRKAHNLAWLLKKERPQKERKRNRVRGVGGGWVKNRSTATHG